MTVGDLINPPQDLGSSLNTATDGGREKERVGTEAKTQGKLYLWALTNNPFLMKPLHKSVNTQSRASGSSFLFSLVSQDETLTTHNGP